MKNKNNIFVLFCVGIIAFLTLGAIFFKHNSISVGDTVRCGDLVSYQYDVKVLRKDGNFIYGSGTMEETDFGNYYPSGYNNIKKTGDRVFDIEEDECFRIDMDGLAIDRINIYKRNKEKNKKQEEDKIGKLLDCKELLKDQLK